MIFTDKNILITGGSGTLGQAIVRTAIAENWNAQFTIFSRSELGQAIMRQKYPDCRYIIGDVRDAQRVSDAIAGHDVVIHAAAMKRIPECEAQPAECYQTNVLGSANVIRACLQHNITQCIGISTDKACQAITAYGASKLLMEKLFLATPAYSTGFVLCRYGNVVASRGSVIPLWRKQVEQGQPITLTDPEMTRFFMAESDAVETIKVAARQSHGTITVPIMRSLKIKRLADRLYPDHPQEVIGLRSTEKMHEDLIGYDESASAIKGDKYNFINRRYYEGQPRFTFSSQNAKPLAIDDFLTMLAEAEQHEVAA